MKIVIQNILIFSSRKTGFETPMVDMVIQNIENHSLSIDRDITAFAKKMERRLLDDSVLFIIFIADDRELDFLLSIEDRITNHALILILPDQHQVRLKKAYKLYPRYIATMDQHIKDTLMVIRKIMSPSKTIVKETA
ncbi:MAG: hypothetical protein KJ737_18425 [Proteobacteria bacterium]|nr:hypothetical protein [Pseudomonadota bacterium]